MARSNVVGRGLVGGLGSLGFAEQPRVLEMLLRDLLELFRGDLTLDIGDD